MFYCMSLIHSDELSIKQVLKPWGPTPLGAKLILLVWHTLDQLTLYVLMDSFIWFVTINLVCSIVYIERSKVMIFQIKLYMYFFL